MLAPGDLLVNLDIVFHFTRVPLKPILELLESCFVGLVVALFQYVLRTTYFLYQEDKFYEQCEGVSMGSPLSPIIADFYMMESETIALDAAPFNPSFYKHYVHNTLLVCSHGIDRLNEFVALNNIQGNIKFTIEIEQADCLPFWHILISRNHDRTLGQNAYRETNTLIYIYIVVVFIIHHRRNL